MKLQSTNLKSTKTKKELSDLEKKVKEQKEKLAKESTEVKSANLEADKAKHELSKLKNSLCSERLGTSSRQGVRKVNLAENGLFLVHHRVVLEETQRTKQ